MDDLGPSSPVYVSSTLRHVGDSTTALGHQMTAIFTNLRSAPSSRPMRVEECLNALMDTLFIHVKEIAANDALQQLLLRLVDSTFEDSTDKGCRALEVVFDLQWRDQHEKRDRCLSLLMSHALKSTSSESCHQILKSIGQVLEENICTTRDLVAEHLPMITLGLKGCQEISRRAASCVVIAKIVETVSAVVKGSPTHLELLSTTCPPLGLLEEAVQSTDIWHRSAVTNLLIVLVKENCYKASLQTAEQIAETMTHYMNTVTVESHLMGVLSILASMLSTPTFRQASWNLPAIASFLLDRDWMCFSKETRATAAYTTGKVSLVLFREDEALYAQLTSLVLRYCESDDIEVVSQCLEVFMDMLSSEQGVHNVAACVKAMQSCICRLPRHLPRIFDVLENIRARYGDGEMGIIYDMIDNYMSMDSEFVNYGKLNAVLHFKGRGVNLGRAEFQKLPIPLYSTLPHAVLTRSLLLVVTLHRTFQLDEMIVLLVHEIPVVRRTALESVVSLCEILILEKEEERRTQERTAESIPLSPPPNDPVSCAVASILDVAVADRDPALRHLALKLLSPQFYPYLSLPENLDALFLTYNDTDKTTQDESLILLCRLHSHYSAIVGPQLMRLQRYMLRDMDALNSSISLATYKIGLLQLCADHNSLLLDPSTVEEVALGHLVQQPFVSKGMSIALLHLLQSILEHSEANLHCHVAHLVTPAVEIINLCDCSRRRRAALDTLCSLLTAIPVTDVSILTKVYRSVSRIIRADEEEEITVAAMKVIGTIGAVNPVKIRHVLHVLETDGIEQEEVVVPVLAPIKPRLRLHTNMAERYPSVVLYYLIKALHLVTDPRRQIEILVAVRQMLQETPANYRTTLLAHLFVQLQTWLRDPAKAHLYETSLLLMTDLAVLSRQFKGLVSSSTGPQLLQSLQRFCSMPQAAQKPLSTCVVQLLDELAKGLSSQEMRDHRWAVEFIHQRLSQNKNDLDLVQRVVKSLESFLEVMHEKDIQLILPHVLQCIEPAKITPAIRRHKMKDINDACFDFINYVMFKQLSLVKDCFVQIVHTIMWYIELSDNQEERDVGLNTLASLVNVLKAPAKRFVKSIERVAEQNGYPRGYFSNLVHTLEAEKKTPTFPINQDCLSPDQPLRLVSQLPRLSVREFENELHSALRIYEGGFEVLNLTNLTGQTVIDFRLTPGPYKGACFNLLTRKAQDSNSSLAHNLGILRLEQYIETPHPVDCTIVNVIPMIPTAKTRKREQSWISWIHATSVVFLKHSPYAALRSAAGAADRNSMLARDLFPFAAVAIISKLPPPERMQLLQSLSRALELSPIDTKQSLYMLAEFMEAERGKQYPKILRTLKKSVYVINRESVDTKFGIFYDIDPNHGPMVTRVTPNGLGAKAGIPLGSYLLAINNQPVYTISDILRMLEGNNSIALTISHYIEERQQLEPKILFNIETLAQVAFQSEMHAKAIYFNEVLFEQLNEELTQLTGNQKERALRLLLDVVKRTIEFYGHLNLTMVAAGLVKYLTNNFSENIIAPKQQGLEDIGILEQLQWWDEALRRYQTRLDIQAGGALDVPALVGVLRCEEALGNVGMVNEIIEKYWSLLDEKSRREVAPYCAKAALSMGEWSKFDELVADHSLVEKLGMVERCAALFRRGEFDQLLEFTRASREAMLESFSDSFKESYSRSYHALVDLQNLSHFEELVSFVHANAERKATLQQLWQHRISQLASKPSNWKTIMSINSLVLTPEEDLASQIMAIRTFTKAHWHFMAEQMLIKLLGPSPSLEFLSRQDPGIVHAYMKHLYETRSNWEVYNLLKNLLEQVQITSDDPGAEKWGLSWLLLGEWTMALFPDNGEDAIEGLLRATQLSPNNSAPFHSLGILHYDLSRNPSTQVEVQTNHHISAVIALFKSVQLLSDHSDNRVVQDILLILSIWFGHCAMVELNEVVNQGIQLLPNHVWLHVIPQLIARIGITTKLARAILADLLVRVGTSYPQALIYPLTVAEKSPDAIRRLMAERVLSGIRVTNNQLVEEASLISNEMVRIAILWSEKWHAAIQQAVYKPDNTKEIMKILSPLYETMENPVTPNERSFQETFGQTLRRAREALEKNSLEKGWFFLKQVYVELSKMLGERGLHMSNVSPTLDSIRDSIVAVPGTFAHGSTMVTIKKFHPRVIVMPSKQKPRRFGLDASDGKGYRFLLKGHEDMRQDERVMQFIGLINTIFMSDNAATSIGLTIPQYAVIPLTDNVGIIGWVENTETIYKMLERYRHAMDVSIYEEVNLIIRKGNLANIEEYHHLPKQQRKILLSYAMECMPNDELRRIIWQRNDSCEQWLSYRSTYGHSLAAMSMVGYVLGLGDRHLNNLMLEAEGTVVHIDFGDCFEVAMQRPLYAEAVPFRLTRLLVSALGITGVDGVYRLTCELVMKNLRRSSENLLAILETFIYDPLINWRLTATAEGDRASGSRGESPHSPNQKACILGDHSAVLKEQPMQLSCSFAKYQQPTVAVVDTQSALENGSEEEIRNQKGDLALLRVHAKLTGQDFGMANTSFSLGRSSWRGEEDIPAGRDSTFWGFANGIHFSESLKDSFTGAPPMLTSYLSLRVLTGGADCLDVPHQVNRLIQEATSLDNLADAYLTGWAPFW